MSGIRPPFQGWVHSDPDTQGVALGWHELGRWPCKEYNADILARYTANRLRVVRQVRYSLHNENCINLLQGRRSALISAAVTGQIDLRRLPARPKRPPTI